MFIKAGMPRRQTIYSTVLWGENSWGPFREKQLIFSIELFFLTLLQQYSISFAVCVPGIVHVSATLWSAQTHVISTLRLPPPYRVLTVEAAVYCL